MSEEEQNLSRRERRAQAKTAKSGGSAEDVKDRNQRLRAEAAAKRRRLRESERESAAQEGLDAGEKMDDALVRGADAGARFLRDNFAWLQWVIIAGVAGAMGMLIYEYRQGVKREKQGAQLASILSTEFGKITKSDPVTPSDQRLVDPRREFASEEERAKKAAKAWGGLKDAKVPMLRIASDLGRAGVLYDQGKNSEARAIYEKVVKDPKISLHPHFKGRAIEGVAFTYEAEQKYAEAKKHFEKLGAVAGTQFKNLQQFHLARMEFLMGNTDKAEEMLTVLDAKLSENAGPEGPTDYVGAAVRDLLKTVDPSRAAAEQQAISAEQMKELMKQFEQMQKGGAPTGAPGSIPTPPPISLPSDGPAPTGAPAPVPEAPAQPAPTSPTPAPKAPAPTPAPAAPAPSPAAPAPKPAAPAPAPAAPVAPVAPAPETP